MQIIINIRKVNGPNIERKKHTFFIHQRKHNLLWTDSIRTKSDIFLPNNFSMMVHLCDNQHNCSKILLTRLEISNELLSPILTQVREKTCLGFWTPADRHYLGILKTVMVRAFLVQLFLNYYLQIFIEVHFFSIFIFCFQKCFGIYFHLNGRSF